MVVLRQEGSVAIRERRHSFVTGPHRCGPRPRTPTLSGRSKRPVGPRRASSANKDSSEVSWFYSHRRVAAQRFLGLVGCSPRCKNASRGVSPGGTVLPRGCPRGGRDLRHPVAHARPIDPLAPLAGESSNLRRREGFWCRFDQQHRQVRL